MRRFSLITGLVISFAGVCLQAQTRLEATIPFEFRIGSAVMPAGEYSIDQWQDRVLFRTSVGKGHAAIHLTMPAARETAQKEPSLTFHRYGDEYFLSQVWSSESRSGVAIPPGARERALMAKSHRFETAGVTALRK